MQETWADGTFEERGQRAAPPRARRAAGSRTRRASKLRVAATVSADAVALLASSVLAVWVVATFDDLPLLRKLHGAFESDPRVGVLLFALLTPYWLAALWVFGLYREPGAQHRRLQPRRGARRPHRAHVRELAAAHRVGARARAVRRPSSR